MSRADSSSPSCSWNSQRYRSPVTCMKVAARAGSQTCSTPSQASRPASHPDIDHQPALGKAEVLHGEPDQVPDRAAGSVAAQHDAARELTLLPAGPVRAMTVTGDELIASTGSCEADDISVPVQGNERVRGCPA